MLLYHELQEERKQTLPSLHDDNDSDSTLVLMAGFTNEPTEEEDVLNQPNAKIKGKEKGDLARNGLTLNSLLNHGTFSIFLGMHRNNKASLFANLIMCTILCNVKQARYF